MQLVARRLQHCLVDGVLPHHQLLDDAEQPLALLLLLLFSLLYIPHSHLFESLSYQATINRMCKEAGDGADDGVSIRGQDVQSWGESVFLARDSVEIEEKEGADDDDDDYDYDIPENNKSTVMTDETDSLESAINSLKM